MGRRALQFLSSLEFAIVLLLVIAAVSAVGTFLDLGAEAGPDDYLKAFGPAVMGVAEALDLHAGRLYATRWFNVLLGLLVANLLLCGVNWLPRTLRAIRFAEPPAGEAWIMEQSRSARFEASPASFDRLADGLRERGFEVRTRENGDGRALVGERHRHGHWGFFITHVGFIVIVIGVIMGRAWSEKGMMVIGEGEMNDVVELRNGGTVKLPFALGLDDFRMEYYSDLIVTSPGSAETARRTVDPGDALRSPDGRYVVRVEAIHPDALVDEHGHVTERSRDFIAPVMEVSVTEGGVEKARTVLHPSESPSPLPGLDLALQYFIDPHHPPKDWFSEIVVIENGRARGRKSVRVNHPLDFGGWRFYQSSYDQEAMRYTVFEAARDPGVPVVYAGFVVLLAGVSFMFFFSHRRVWAVYTPGSPSGRLAAAGWTYQAHRVTHEWFEPLLEAARDPAESKGGER